MTTSTISSITAATDFILVSHIMLIIMKGQKKWKEMRQKEISEEILLFVPIQVP